MKKAKVSHRQTTLSFPTMSKAIDLTQSDNPPIFIKNTPKKLVIKHFKQKPTLPPDYFETALAKLRSAVVAIYNRTAISDSLEELYKVTDLLKKTCENLCHYQKAKEVFEALYALIRKHVQSEKDALDIWQNYVQQMILIRNIFLYMDRTYLLQTPGMRPLWETSLDVFRELIFQDEKLRQRIVEAMISLILSQRNGDLIDTKLLQECVKMMQELSIYFSAFEPELIRSTEKYYQDLSLSHLPKQDTEVVHYLELSNGKRLEEIALCDPYAGILNFATLKRLIQIIDHLMIETHIGLLLEKGVDYFMDEEKYSECLLLFDSIARVKGLELMRQTLSRYIIKRGETFVCNPSQDSSMVENILKFKQKCLRFLTDSFRDDSNFSNAIKEAFEQFMNLRANKPAEMIAKSVDQTLKSKLTEEDMEARLLECLGLFRLIQGKDVFEAFYKKDLAKRLLLGKSNNDAERNFMNKLKHECGPNFTQKIEGMFKDMELSKELMISFPQPEIEMSVNILTDGYWPSYTSSPLQLPEELASSQELYKNYYLGKYNGRKLSWQNNLCHCVLKINFPKGKKEVSVSLFQATVLLLFNSHTKLSFSEIQSLTSMESKELMRTCQSLACSKNRLLIKEPSGQTVQDEDIFTVNLEFSNPHYRLKMNSIQVKETQEEQERTQERVFLDRVYVVDAAIVRIMKTRMTLEHEALIAEIMNQLKFKVVTSDLKKRIESLIDREYLKRDEENSKIYHYVA